MKKKCLLILSSLSLSLVLSGCGGGTPATADAAVLKVVNSIQKDDPSAIWNALPESYQKDVNGAVREFAAKVDPEVWKAFAETAEKVEDVLRSKKSLIMELPMAAALGKDAKDTKNYDQIVAMLGTLTKSDLMSHSKMKNFDGGDFLGDTGASLMKQMAKIDASTIQVPGAAEPLSFKKELAGIGAKVLKSEGDTATVEMSKDGKKTVEQQFVRVEGKWIPKDMADGWKAGMDEMKKNLSSMGTMDAKQKAQLIAMTTMAKGVLDQMLKAKTKEDLMGAMGALDMFK